MLDVTISSILFNIILLIAIFYVALKPKLGDGLQEKDILDAVVETEQNIATANDVLGNWLQEIKNVIEDPTVDDVKTIETIKNMVELIERK